MPVLGLYDELIDVDPASFDADRPVSVWPALILQSNIQHIITQKPQTRVNWRACINTGTTRDGFIVDNSGDTPDLFEAMYCQLFELTWIKEDRPCGLYVVLYGMADGIPAESGSVVFRLRVVPANSPVNDLSVEPILNFSGTLLADTDDAEIFADWIKPEPNASLARTFLPLADAVETLEGNINHTNPHVSLVRAEILMTATSGTTSFGITGLTIREFFT